MSSSQLMLEGSSSSSKSSSVSQPHVNNSKSSELRKLGCALLIIAGCGGLITFGVGLANLRFEFLDKKYSIAMIALGSFGSVTLFVFSYFCYPKTEVIDKARRAVKRKFPIKKRKIFPLQTTVIMDATAKNQKGQSALHEACRFSNDYLHIESLIEGGIDVNEKDADGNTPLHLAAQRLKTYPIVKILLDNGADATAKNSKGQTPLHLACSVSDSHPVIVELLQEYEVDLNATDNKNYTPLHYACKAGNFYIAAHLIDFDVEVDREDTNGNTPLHFASGLRGGQRNENIIEELLLKHANRFKKNAFNEMPDIKISIKQASWWHTGYNPMKAKIKRQEAVIKRKKGEEAATDYEILGVDETASLRDIKIAYRKRMLEFHPDKIYKLSDEDDETFQKRQAEAAAKTVQLNAAIKRLCPEN